MPRALTLAISNPILDTLQTAQQMGKAASQTDNSRMKALAAATTALSAANTANAIQADPSAAVGISASLSVGASGAGAQSDLRFRGGDITAPAAKRRSIRPSMDLFNGLGSTGSRIHQHPRARIF